MRQLVIKGNLVIPTALVNGNGILEAFSDLRNVDDNAIVINGDVIIKHPLTINYELYVTGEITQREV